MNKEAYILAVEEYKLHGFKLRLSGVKMILRSRAYAFAKFNLSLAALFFTVKKEFKNAFMRS